MQPRHYDLWDQSLAFINEAFDEFFKMIGEGKLSEFEQEWHDPIAKLSVLNWFADARAGCKELAYEQIRIEIKNLIKNCRLDERLLDANFG
jgi:hypothetical protein